jgi:hypothetical protein
MTVTGRSRWCGWVAGAAITLTVALPACTSSHRNAAGSPAGNGNPAATSAGSPSGTGGKPGASTTTRPTSSAARPGSPATSSSGGGNEGATGSPAEKCPVTTSAAVGSAFAATVAHEQVGTSGIGSPLCTFSLKRGQAGAFGAVTATAISGYPASAFAQSRNSSPGAQTLAGLGSSAFYLPRTSTVKVLDGSNALTLQYTGYLAGSAQPTPDRVRAALISLAKAYLAQN